MCRSSGAHVGAGWHAIAVLEELCHLLPHKGVAPRVSVGADTALEGSQDLFGPAGREQGDRMLPMALQRIERGRTNLQLGAGRAQLLEAARICLAMYEQNAQRTEKPTYALAA